MRCDPIVTHTPRPPPTSKAKRRSHGWAGVYEKITSTATTARGDPKQCEHWLDRSETGRRTLGSSHPRPKQTFRPKGQAKNNSRYLQFNSKNPFKRSTTQCNSTFVIHIRDSLGLALAFIKRINQDLSSNKFPWLRRRRELATRERWGE